MLLQLGRRDEMNLNRIKFFQVNELYDIKESWNQWRIQSCVVCCSAFRALGIKADKNANRFDFVFLVMYLVVFFLY